MTLLNHLQVALIRQFDLVFIAQRGIEADEDVFDVVLARLVGFELKF